MVVLKRIMLIVVLSVAALSITLTAYLIKDSAQLQGMANAESNRP